MTAVHIYFEDIYTYIIESLLSYLCMKTLHLIREKLKDLN